MGDPDKGIDHNDALEGGSEWYIVSQAECSIDTLEDLFDNSTDAVSEISNLIDDDEVDQGNSLALFTELLTEDSNRAVADLKRKFTNSPPEAVESLSPRLHAVHITPQKSIKRRLFRDSGIEQDETENLSEKVVDTSFQQTVSFEQQQGDCLDLFRSTNWKATFLYKIKEIFGVSYTEITRSFKSNKTCSQTWVIAVYNARDEMLEAAKIHLENHCDFFQIIICNFSGLFLCQFKAAKCRETVEKLFVNLLNVNAMQILSEPPRTRSAAVALYFFQKSLTNVSYKFGDFPDWVRKHTQLNHEASAAADTFELSEMIQWCYDNNYTEESIIAYRYAMHADSDRNAAAFLKSNHQAKYVKDACIMVKYYKMQEMKEMTISDWIWKCCDETKDDGNWKTIALFFKYQNVNFLSFLCALRSLFKQIPKKNCLVFYGPSDTGKSYFCNTLVSFMRGKVVSFMNRQSHFWLQNLLNTKIGFLDDATMPCWLFMDTNMRNALDGNPVCLDAKHKTPVQIVLPPLLVTTNVDVESEPALKYLKTRLTIFTFPNPLPFNPDGSLVYNITNETWASFFRKLGMQIDLTPKEDIQDESGRSDKPFRCTTRETYESL